MKKYKVTQTLNIISGYQELTYHIEANSAAEAEELVSDNDADDFCIDIDTIIDQSEEMEIESEER